MFNFVQVFIIGCTARSAPVSFITAGRELVEYTFLNETLVVESRDDVSIAVLKIVFRRRIEYHLTNTFMQTEVLTLVGFMSFFFSIDNFTDRMMVSLTTLLVVATVTTTIQSVSTRHEQ